MTATRILLHDETLEPTFVPPQLVHRQEELTLLHRRYRDSLTKGIPYHMLLTGGIGSGKTALVQHLGNDLERVGKIGSNAVLKLYVNCWRRASDRTVLLHLLRGLGVSLPDRGYSISEMLDVFEQGIRKAPRHLLVILDEASALVRQETKLVYLLSRSGEVGLGSISLMLIATEDLLPYLDPASRSSFGVTHRLALRPYDAKTLIDILESRATLALRPGSWDRSVLEQIARIAAPSGDARFALEVLTGAARVAENDQVASIRPEDVRAAKGSIYPTVTESRLEELPTSDLFVLLALARSLRGATSSIPSQKLREKHAALIEEYGAQPISRTTFWRALKGLEREGLLALAPTGNGSSATVSMDEMPTSYLTTVLEERIGSHRPRKA
ncbi:MAG: AAA family ATPase [Thermoplasmata archaeon]